MRVRVWVQTQGNNLISTEVDVDADHIEDVGFNEIEDALWDIFQAAGIEWGLERVEANA